MKNHPTFVLGAIVILACQTGSLAAQSPAGPDSVAARVASGKTLFQGKGLCFSCHGKEGEGLLGPSTKLAGRTLVHVKPTLDQLVALIKAGIDSAHSSIAQVMPARGGSRMTDKEVETVAWYVLDLQKKPHRP